MESSPIPSTRVGTAPYAPPALLTRLERAVAYLVAQQHSEGFVRGDVTWSPIITAQYVMVAHITDMGIPPQRREGFLHHFRATQLADGSWGLHPESEGYVFVTALVYVAMRLLGVPANDAACASARRWLAGHGGVAHIPGWGRLWLAMLNLYGYEGIQPVLPELWLLPDALPLHPSRLYCHTRLIYLGFSYLYAVRFQAPVTPLIADLRAELYTIPYGRIDFAAYLDAVAPTDVPGPPSRALRLSNLLLRGYDRIHSRRLRRQALRRELDMIVFHQRQNDGAAISPVNGLLNVLALHHAGHPDAAPSFRGVDYWLWSDEALGQRLNGAHSHTWDTAFGVQAITAVPGVEQTSFLDGAARYLRDAQMRDDIAGGRANYLDRARGGYCFSDKRHGWPVSDCSAEALSAWHALYDRADPALRPDPPMLVAAMRFILSRQNDDGGFSSFERRRGPLYLERLNPADMFRDCMVEHSYVECTGSCVQALRHGLEHWGPLLTPTDRAATRRACRRGVAFLRSQQRPDGAWPGFWGINFTYGTLFAVSGLLAGGVPRDDPAIARACRWLVATRLPDGGWGESWRSCLDRRPVAHERSQVIMTSWALITLLRAGYSGPGAGEAILGGVRLLLDRQLPSGNWPQESVAGIFFGTAMLHYGLYRTYFPIWALGLYAQTRGQAPAEGTRSRAGV